MLQIRNVAALSSAVTIQANGTIPFDTIVANTNDRTEYVSESNAIRILQPGRYQITCIVTGTANSAGALTLKAIADDEDLQGVYQTVTFGTTADTICVDMPINVTYAASGFVEIKFAISGQIAASNINAYVKLIP